MLTPALLLVGTLLADGDSSTVRAEKSTALWFEPQLRFHAVGSGRADIAGSDASALPLGLEVGRQVGAHLLLSLAAAALPVQNIETIQVTGGGRWYLRDHALAPYLAAEVGVIKAEVDDTGGLTHTDVFAAAGPGLELTLRNGFSLMTDLQAGPENTGDARGDARTWHLSAWYRLGLGYRF